MRIRQLTLDDVSISLEAEPDEAEVPEFQTDEPEKDEEDRREILERAERGDVWAWCVVNVTVTWSPSEGVSFSESESLGGCSYQDEEDFCADDGSYKDMVDGALSSLNARLQGDVDALAALLAVGPAEPSSALVENVRAVLPTASFAQDVSGQIVVHTGLREVTCEGQDGPTLELA